MVRVGILYYFFVYCKLRADRALLRIENIQLMREQGHIIKVKFPMLGYKGYCESLSDASSKSDQNFKEGVVCPICCDAFKLMDMIVYLPCNV